MRITKLQIRNFRNISAVDIDPHPRFTILYGDNAQGKTNVLESIYLLSCLKSFRKNKTSELIQWGQKEARIKGVVLRRGITQTIQLELQDQIRKVRMDGKYLQKITSFFGSVNVVMFSPEDMAITKGTPSERRRFIDMAIFNLLPEYPQLIKRYEAILKNRNQLLKAAQKTGRLDDSLLDVYTTQISQCAAKIVLRRLWFIVKLEPIVNYIFCRVVGHREADDRVATLKYLSSLHLDSEYASHIGCEDLDPQLLNSVSDEFMALYRKNRMSDKARGFTGLGPHIDDLELFISGRSLKQYASQGQHRAFILALKIAEISFLKNMLGYYPILLLDDVSSELDSHRNRYLMDFLKGFGGQVFITTTDRAYIKIDEVVNAFGIRSGDVFVSDTKGC